ncbi:MAG: DegV family protein [Herbinix sp.]|nr:DegV family protein [Herbinix sp.]
MKDFVITTDSNSDLLESYINEKQIGIIPHYYDLEGITYGDEINLTPKEFYDKMRAGLMPTTMASNPEVIRKTFQSYIDQGLDILHISFSSVLSGGCSNVVTGAREICEDNPGAKIVVVDTLSASLGEGMFVMKAADMKDEGKSIDEIAAWLDDHKQEFCIRFTVDDLGHLHRGGRISKTTAIIGSMINIKPILSLSPEGKLEASSSARGRKKSLSTICNDMIENMGSYKDSTDDVICIVHGDAYEDAKYLEVLIKEKLPNKKIIINYVSPSIGAHSGPGAIGLCFMGNKR